MSDVGDLSMPEANLVVNYVLLHSVSVPLLLPFDVYGFISRTGSTYNRGKT